MKHVCHLGMLWTTPARSVPDLSGNRKLEIHVDEYAVYQDLAVPNWILIQNAMTR
jgi:hypothetical protein